MKALSLITLAIIVCILPPYALAQKSRRTSNKRQSAKAASNKPTDSIAQCTLTLEQAPEIRGMRLGMSPADVMNRYPLFRYDGRDLVTGVVRLGFSARVAPSNDLGDLKGIAQVYPDFLDNRLIYLYIKYSSTPFNNIDEFAAGISTSLKLPDAWQQASDKPSSRCDGCWDKEINCSGFRVRVGWESGLDGYGMYISGGYVISIEDTAALELVENRKREKKEKEQRDFKP